MFEYDFKDAEAALPEMSKALALFDDGFVTRNMVEKFIIDKQDHYNLVKAHLKQKSTYKCYGNTGRKRIVVSFMDNHGLQREKTI